MMNQNDHQKPVVSQAAADKEIDLAELLGQLNANRKKILGIAAGVLFIAALYAFTATPIYTANALLQVEEQKKGLAGMEGIAGLLGEATSSLAEIEILRSRSVLGPVVKDMNLHILTEPNYFPIFGKAIARRHGKETFGSRKL